MKKALVALVGAALAACASSGGEGTTTDWGANSFVNAADLGDGRWLITCTNAPSACTSRARKICEHGFDLVDMDSDKSTVAGGSLNAFAVGRRKDYEIIVQCNEPEPME